MNTVRLQYLCFSKLSQLGFLLILFLSVKTINAQTRNSGTINYLNFEQKPVYFGITLGYNSANFKAFHSKDLILNESIAGSNSGGGPGLNLGIVTNFKVGKYFDFRFLPTLSFTERRLEYRLTETGESVFDQPFAGVLVETPFHIRYKSAVYNDKRMFVIAGVKYSYDLANNADVLQADNLVKVSASDFAFEFGAGVQFFLPYFIFSPEIKFSHGLGNLLIQDQNLIQSKVLEKLESRVWTISLHFEG